MYIEAMGPEFNVRGIHFICATEWWIYNHTTYYTENQITSVLCITSSQRQNMISYGADQYQAWIYGLGLGLVGIAIRFWYVGRFPIQLSHTWFVRLLNCIA